MYRVAICDDEPMICSEIEEFINEYSRVSQTDIDTDVFFSGRELTNTISEQGEEFDLILLDIEMSNGNGIFVGDYLRNIHKDDQTQIAIVSGKDGYDRQLFEFRPFCFIEKPVKYDDICKLLNRYRKLFGSSNKIFSFKSGHRDCWIQLSKIMYFESNDRKVKIICSGENAFEFYGAMESVFEQVKAAGFMMIHKSYIINYRYIRSFLHNQIQMEDGEWLPVSKHRKNEVLKWQILMEKGGDKFET